MTDKVRENRLRRIADRQGLALVKSPRRDPNAVGYGRYALVERYDLTLDQVEDRLAGVKRWPR